MKGVILAGGLGSRLRPLTFATNKHLLPVWDQPMIYYPIQTLVKAGIKEIMIVVSDRAGDFITVLKNGEELGLKTLTYGYQEKPDGGIADALAIAEGFAEDKPIAVILGDNTTDADISKDVKQFQVINDSKSKEPPRAYLFLQKTNTPERFGVAFPSDDGKKLSRIEEKPQRPTSDLAVTGIYLYDSHVFEFIKECEPSQRGELEITDVNNMYIEKGHVDWSMLDGFWQDAGSFESLWKAGSYWRNKNQ